MKKIFDKIVFDDIEVDYTGYLENDIKRYIFAKSDTGMIIICNV